MSGLKVLVVEDEPLVRIDIADSLVDAGFEVIEAANAAEAIAALESYADIRLIFTDIDMPGSMDGLKLASAVRDRWPPVKIIVTSGHRNLRDDELPIEGRFFSKPYNHVEVANAVTEMAAIR